MSETGRPEDARILVVDDQQLIVVLITRMLERAGFTSVTGTCEPGSVVERLARDAPDLLILDLVMPRLDGVELLERLRPSERRPTPLAVLVVSGESADSPRADRARAAGAAAVLEKPFGRVQLVAAVRDALA
jgi:two-component system response regulator ResD